MTRNFALMYGDVTISNSVIKGKVILKDSVRVVNSKIIESRGEEYVIEGDTIIKDKTLEV
jgi:hypothetical protein